MTTSVSVRPPTNPLHQSLSVDDQDQYYSTMNDETICTEYLNEITTGHQSQSKDGVYRLQNDQQAIPARSSSNATKPGISPYLQKLPHSNFLQVMLPRPSSSSTQQRRQRRRRRRSTSTGRTREELLDSAYQRTNVDHLDLSSFFANSNNSFNRPTSAPTRTMPSSAKKKRTGTSVHKTSSKGQTFIITIYRNGDHDKSCYCKANSLNAILQYATEKLHMSSAARRLFDSNGQEIYRVEDIQANQEYYVSSGENFKDPFKSIQVQTEYSLNSTWTMKGLQTDAVKPKSFTTKTVISKRLDKQIKTSICLTIIENGFGHNDAICYMLIDTVLKENFEKFLEECTKKLELTGHARKVFNYRGDEKKSLKTFLESNECTIKTVHDDNVYGPLWISKGERFRPTGAYTYLELRYTEFQLQYKKLKKHYKEIRIVIKTHKQRRMIEDDDNETSGDEQISSTEGTDREQNKTNDKSSIKDKSLLSMTIKELKEAKQTLENKIKETEDLMKFYKAKMAEIKEAKDEEKELGPKFPIDHIIELEFHHKMVGRHPLCLIIHENGSVNSSDPMIYLNLRSLPSKSTLQTSIEYLLQYLQTSVEMFARQRPKRVFDITGNEIKLIGQLKQKQHLFISYGEDYRPAYEPCLTIELHYLDVYEKNGGTLIMKALRSDDETIGNNEKRTARQLAADWKPTETIPDDIQKINFEKGLTEDDKIVVNQKSIHDRISANVTFIYKNKKIIYPELKIKQIILPDSKPKSNTNKPPPKRVFSDIDLQTWCYDKDGYIYNKQINSLVLTVISEQNIRLTWTSVKSLASQSAGQKSLDGYGVQLRSKKDSSPNQIWDFTTDGYIVSKVDPNLALTSVASIESDEDGSFIAKGMQVNADDPFILYLAVCSKCSKCSANLPFISQQRWGIRQISGFTIGDWKYSKVENPLWHKLALTWPVDGTGAKIPELQWPVEGCLLPNVPPIKSLKSTQAPVAFVPIRLQVLKNGERDLTKSVPVVGPDISNLILEPKASSDMYRRLRIPKPEKEQRAHRQIKRMADARQREIKLFLETCTTLCNLPFAARRLFDTHGTELFDLTSIERDSYVYVTCGEQWIDPELTKAEQQRRLLLAYLSNDVRMIAFYCSLRNPKEYVISTERGFIENSRLVLNRCALNAKQRNRVENGELIEHVIENEEPIEEAATELEPSTAHERSHKTIDRQSKEKFRWPWEKIANKSLNLETDDDDVVMLSNDDQNLGDSFSRTADTLSLSKSVRKLPRSAAVSMQKFNWESSAGYISCADDSNLVFGVKEIESKVVEVILKRRNPDDIFQRWMFLAIDEENQSEYHMDLSKPFLIVSKARPTMVLTVLLPSCTGNESNEVNISCVGCTITLQQRRYEENGCANQKWAFNEKLGFIFSFNSTSIDKELTAANRANICSYTVSYEALSQSGFIASVLNINDQSEDVPVCLACAQAMRGKYRLVKIDSDKKFTCAIGKRNDLKFHGPFQCLNHKVDLTQHEAENTLLQRREQLEQLRQEASVRNIAKELAAAKPIQIIHLLAYRNGDGHTRPGQLLVGSSIIGFLDQATHRLSLTNAARRLYGIDGTVILTIEDLIDWAKEYYKKRYLELTKSKPGSLLDNVELNTPLPPQNPDSKRRSSVDNQSEKTTLSTKLRDISPSKQRYLGLPKASDIKRAIKQSSLTTKLDIDMNYLLKFPIEIWVSSGEPFVHPTKVDQRQSLRISQREQRTIVEHDFEREKHTLRLMKGRRISSQSPGDLVPQQNPNEPVLKKGQWTEKTDAELDKEDDVELLRTSLDEIRISQQPEITRPISSAATDRLGQHSKIKRIMVYLNGEPKETAIQCFGSNLNELMDNAKFKWNLMQPIQALFDENGHLIERFDQLNRDQYVCVSTTKTFITSSEKQREVDIKANWARTRNKYGDQATDIRVNSTLSSAPQLVDPFGPPLLTLNDQQQTRPTTKPPIVPAPFYRRLAIEQPAPASAVVSEVTPSPTIMKDSLLLSDNDNDDDDNDDGPNSEIERITNVKNDDDDDDGLNSEMERITNVKTDEAESSRPITPRFKAQARSPFSQLFTSEPPPTKTPASVPSTTKFHRLRGCGENMRGEDLYLRSRGKMLLMYSNTA
ncbi:unnamed protein product [Rotaria sp. Silwood1]|nr:unnamed protein product [Rotaria sp. Silwood1]CAF1027022.1 unnamed protein product [Rotaria sp. Silwood1]CAF3421503.1 unnamed protein product [Rotaria sp. Silwood1]CAF3425884.1 unnamed protein product [Rotaria sp. Silwood1]CAF4511595.1 unnamed protein product [Rotaria sp. Silwood1]